MKGVYLLHFSEPYKHARHYLGWSPNIADRLAAHQAGKGARLLQVIVEAGIGFVLVRVWPGLDPQDEAAMKRWHHTGARHCPVCHGRPVDDELVSYAARERPARYYSRLRLTPAQALAEMPDERGQFCPICQDRRVLAFAGDAGDQVLTWECLRCGRADLAA